MLDFDCYLDYDSTNSVDIPTRVSKDHVLDLNGRRLLDLCKSTNLLIGNGRLHNDKTGEFTFYSKNGMSVVDYLLFKFEDVNCIADFQVMSMNEFSDHCPLLVSFQLSTGETTPTHTNRERESNTDSHSVSKRQVRWEESKANDYRKELMNNHEVLVRLTDDIDQLNVDNAVDQFTRYLTETADRVFTQNNPGVKSKKKQNKSWYNKDCFKSKIEFNKLRNAFSKNKSNLNRTRFINARTIYNREKKKAKRAYMRTEGQRISRLSKQNPKAFWKELKKRYNKKSINDNDFCYIRSF